jgi:putative ABC transport system permease protein
VLKNNLKIALRGLFKNRLYSFINIIGLAVGLAASILILLWISDEVSFNSFHKNIDRIFAIPQTQHYQTIGDLTVMPTPLALAPALKQEIPEIRYITRYEPYLGKQKISYDGKTFNEQVNFADPDFFNVFSFRFIEGDNKNVLKDLSSIIITKDAAEKYFGSENPIGKTLRMNNKFDLTVKGVINNVPQNSDIQFDMLVPIKLLKDMGYNMNSWGQNMVDTYAMLYNPNQTSQVKKKIEGRLKRELNAPTAGKLFLFPFKNYHLYSIRGNGGRIETVMIFSIIAFFILTIACINFINLTTAKSAKRSTEVAIKKVVGASRLQVAKQFFSESVLLTFISFIFSLFLLEVFLPYFNSLSGKNLVLSQISYSTILLILLIAVFTGIIAGIYPALFLSSFKPVNSLKSKIYIRTSRFPMRKILIVFQFAISIILIVCTSVVYLQMKYVMNKNLGLDKNNILYFNLSNNLHKNSQALKSELLGNPNINSVTETTALPIFIYNNGGGWTWQGKPARQEELVSMIGADYDFLKTYNIKLLEGRYYSADHSADDSLSIVINKSFADLIGFKNPIGQTLKFNQLNINIIGVVRDFNFSSLNSKIGPLVIYNNNSGDILSMKINNTDNRRTINFVNDACKKFDPDFVINYQFMDKTYEQTYTAQTRLEKIFFAFALLAIIISCLGLLGLASYISEVKTKEIGIRKVLGAKVAEIVLLMSGDFIKWVLVANIIAWPIAYYFMNRWLDDFAYRISFPYWVLFASGILALLIALITVGSQAVRAANLDPVKSLRYE